MKKPKPFDFMEYEIGKKHWLSMQERFPEVAIRVRAKYRALHKARQAMDRINAKLDRMGARLKDRQT